jgi:hypothetical protein
MELMAATQPMSRAQKIVGYGAIALSVVSFLMGLIPWIPVRFEAYAVGVVLFGIGAWVLAGRELRDTIRRAFRAFRQGGTDGRRPGRRTGPASVSIDPLLPVRILKLAKSHAGVLTVAEVAMNLDVPLDHAEAGLSECVRAGNAVPDYDIPRAHPVFRFPEFLEPDPPRISS